MRFAKEWDGMDWDMDAWGLGANYCIVKRMDW